MQAIKLIVTDLDGTLTGNDTEQAYCTHLAEVLGEYRARFDTVWAVCSGRSAGNVRDTIESLHQLGLNPDYVIVRSAFVYRTDRHKWHAMHVWNWGIRMHMLMNFFYLKSALQDWQRELNRTFKNVICLHQRRDRLCLRFRNREDADAGANILQKKAQAYNNLRVFQYLTEVELRSVMHTKGMAVEELAGRLQIKRSEVLCIGNGTSDISMLDGSFAVHTGCPSNAEMDVLDQVHKMRGYIATEKSMAGVVEIMKGYLSGTVRSDLPAWWSPTHVSKHPRIGRSRRRPPPRAPMHANQRLALQIGLLSVYAVLVVFASFDLLPFSAIIMKPFVVVSEWVAYVLEVFM